MVITNKSTTQELKTTENVTNAYRNLVTKSNLLLHLMHEMAKTKDRKKLSEVVNKYSLRIFGVSASAIYFPSPNKKKLLVEDLNIDSRIKLKKSLLEEYSLATATPIVRAFKTKKVLAVSNELINQKNSVSIKNSAFFPILSRQEVLGVFALRSTDEESFSLENLKLGELLALHTGVKIHNQSLTNSVRAQKDTLELLQNSVNEGLSLHGVDGVIYYANNAIGHFFGNTRSTIGVKREDLVKNWKKYHRYEISRLYDSKAMQKTVYEDKKPFVGNLMVIHSTPPKLIEANYYPVLKNSSFAGMAAAYRDVTKEKKQEEELANNFKRIQKERDRWEAVFSNVDEGIFLLDKNFKITHMNAACEILTGFDLKDSLGKSYYDLVAPHTSSGLYFPDYNPLEKILITKEAIPYEEHQIFQQDSREVWIGMSAAPIKDTNDAIQEIVVVMRDVSSLKEVEKAKSQFVSIASHELRTPLTVINGYLSLLINGDLGDFKDDQSRERLQTVLAKVYNETGRLTHLVSDLLNVSRIEEKRIQLNKQPVTIDSVAREVIDELTLVAKEKNVHLVLKSSVENQSLEATFDKDKIYQVILNLVDNAIKFTDGGGEVAINYWKENGKVYVAVKDDGIGIPKNLQSIIFEKFQQVPGSYLKENRGTGLGLFIVKSLVELHDGDLAVQSEPGKGSQFIFSLPG